MTYTHATRETEEAAIERFAAQAARRTRNSLRSFATAAATAVYDEARDHAYDILLAADDGSEGLVDLLLGDVTDAAVALVLS